MAFNNSAGRNNSMTPMPPQSTPQNPGEPALTWEEMGSQRFQPKGQRRHILTVLSIVLSIMFIFAGIRVGVELSGTNDQLQVRVGDQQTALVDLRQSIPISPQIRGANVFPLTQSQDIDQTPGVMTYTPKMVNDIKTNMKLGVLLLSNSAAGDKTVFSYQQLDQFAGMLNDSGAEGMIQVHIGGPTAPNNLHSLTTDPATRAALAGQWVDAMNHKASTNRPATMKNFHAVKYWIVGNAPDTLINPLTNQKYTAGDFASLFITFSLAMHKVDSTIQVFGPDLSQFYGIGAGPADSAGNLWMESFLKAVADYETKNPQQLQAGGGSFHLLDGVSFHYFPLQNNAIIPSQLMSNPSSWEYLIPQLHDAVKQIMGHDLPINISAINTNSTGINRPTQGQSALWWADTLGELMNERVSFASFYAASYSEQAYPLFTNDGLHNTAMERVMETFSNLQSNLVPLSIGRNPISVYATQDTTHQNVSLLFVNKSNLPQSAEVDPVNDFLGLSPWHSVSISVGANSVIVLTLHRDGLATEALYFQVSAQNDNTVNTVTHVTCGTKADPLNSNIPC